MQYDLNLSLNHTISTSTYSPYSITDYNNQMYVRDYWTGSILIIVNKVIISAFNTCHGNSVQLAYILFDSCAYMATSCYNNQLYLYYIQTEHI